jgi:putative membrane-bound dehydrogenase-like protein
MKSQSFSVFRSILTLSVILLGALQAAPKKIIFISHLSSHGSGQHEYAAGCQLIGQWLEQAYGKDQVTWEHHINWPKDPDKAFRDAATVVFFCSGGNGHLVNSHVAEFDKVMRRGVGLACLHYGVEVPIGPPGKGMLNWMGGYFETHWSVNPHWVASFEAFPDHPAAQGIKPFKSDDEWYFHMRFRAEMEGITPILSAKAPVATMKRGDGPHSGNPAVRDAVANGELQHVAWTYQRGEDYGNGRGFGFTGIHYHKNLGDKNFRQAVLNGVAWSAQLEIPEGGVPSSDIDQAGLDESVRATTIKFGGKPKPKKKPKPKPKKKEQTKNADPRDPSNAVAAMDVHPELQAELFAAEPLLKSPSSIDIDYRGRVWVCEVVNYRRHNGKRPEGDRILILEDSDGDGKADTSKVFYQSNDIDSIHGICVLGKRVIASAGDQVLSLFDDNGDDIADRKEVMFTNIGGAQHDHGIHAFMFGPDGRLYFNFGNAAKRLCDAEGKVIVDLAGNKVEASRRPYQEGMVFRCDLDGSNVETLGWNFRNNWEACVDSFGAIWQSDNDDDGNRGVRINYVMEYGNYGYRDEFTGAGWRDKRVSMEETIPLQHWHLNDPGVVPNLLQTGAGSPTGITVYEGDLLPAFLHGQMIHCDAGPNVCRAYPVTKDGAGYKAEMVNLLSSSKDRWYRPSDVAVAPDGSLMVADWYDPGVGGHGMGDLERGRVFRLTPKGHQGYKVPAIDVSTTDGALAALKSPHNETRFLGWTALTDSKMAGKAGRSLFIDDNASPQHRARGLFLYGWHKQGQIKAALTDTDPNIRMAGLRLARQHNDRVLEAIETLVGDPDPQVRRECAVALRFDGSAKASKLWAELAAQHDGKDRWYLEALGIGADLHWDARLAALDKLNDQGGGVEHIVWRSRGKDTAKHLAKSLLTASDHYLIKQTLRAFDFQAEGEVRDTALLEVFDKSSAQARSAVVFQLPADRIKASPQRMAKVQSMVKDLQGKPELVRLAAHLDLENVDRQLHDYIFKHPKSNESVQAARTLLRRSNDVEKVLLKSDQPAFSYLADAIGKTGDASGVKLLAEHALDSEHAAPTRVILTKALAQSNRGEKRLLKAAKDKALPNDLEFTVAALLGRARDRRVREEIGKVLTLPPIPGAEKFPPIAELVRHRGHANKGKAAFTKAICNTCHKIGGEGIDFGPDLSEIGDKLSVEGLFEGILYPNNAISHGFHGVVMTKEDGQQVGGYIVSETDDKVSLRLPGGITQALAADQITKREDMKLSLMPPGLAAALSTQELADLVAYLGTLKAK